MEILNIDRWPPTNDRSLIGYSSADRLMVQKVQEEINDGESIFIINDRFGYQSINLANKSPHTLYHLASQHDAIIRNAENHKVDQSLQPSPILTHIHKTFDYILIRIPKSNDLLELLLYLANIYSNENTKVILGFMTKYFNPTILDICSKYFENIEQSKAWKKARVITASHSIRLANKTLDHYKNNLEYNGFTYQQYYGVFSSQHIDFATSFLLENLPALNDIEKAMDLACGNGIIGKYIQEKYHPKQLVLVDDSLLATASARLNIDHENAIIEARYNLESFEDYSFDLIITNPPFHQEHDNIIDITLNLFKDSSRILIKGGVLLIVANKHLNYKTHLIEWFTSIETIKENNQFVIYQAVK